MDAVSIAKNFIGFQKQSFNNLIDAMTIFQNQAERTSRLLTNQMGINENTHEFADQWRAVLIKSREDTKRLINDNFTRLEDYFAGLEQKKPSK